MQQPALLQVLLSPSMLIRIEFPCCMGAQVVLDYVVPEQCARPSESHTAAVGGEGHELCHPLPVQNTLHLAVKLGPPTRDAMPCQWTTDARSCFLA